MMSNIMPDSVNLFKIVDAKTWSPPEKSQPFTKCSTGCRWRTAQPATLGPPAPSCPGHLDQSQPAPRCRASRRQLPRGLYPRTHAASSHSLPSSLDLDLTWITSGSGSGTDQIQHRHMYNRWAGGGATAASGAQGTRAAAAAPPRPAPPRAAVRQVPPTALPSTPGPPSASEKLHEERTSGTRRPQRAAASEVHLEHGLDVGPAPVGPQPAAGEGGTRP